MTFKTWLEENEPFGEAMQFIKGPHSEGWITPDNHIVGCDRMHHLQAAGLTDKQIARKIAVRMTHLKRAEKAFSDRTGNTEWHAFDLSDSNFRNEIYAELYLVGWVRLSVSKPPWSTWVHAEGLDSRLSDCSGLLRDLAQAVGGDPHEHKQGYTRQQLCKMTQGTKLAADQMEKELEEDGPCDY